MGTIKYSNDQDLVARVSNPSKGKNKSKDSNKNDKKKQYRPKCSYGVSNPCKDKDKKGKEKTKCTYCHKGWHPESACMKKNINMMAQLLEKKNILVPEGIGKKDGGSSSDKKERCHALVVGSSDSSTLFIYSRASRHMASVKYFFTSMYSDSGTTI